MQEAKIIRIIRCVTIVICVIAVCVTVFKVSDIKFKNSAATTKTAESTSYEDVNVVEVTDKNGETVTDKSGGAVTSKVHVSGRTTKNSQTANQQGTTAKSKSTTKAQGGLNSNSVSEVLSFYKKVAAKNANLSCTKYLTLTSLNGGSGFAGSAINAFEGIASSALESNSGIAVPFPGNPGNISASDWTSASAVSDGTYTTITVRVKTQTDGYNGREYEGPVGRSMQVLPGVQTAVNEMSGVSADFSTSNMKIEYQNPTIRIKVLNSNLQLVRGACEWKYNTHIAITYLEAKITFIPVKLQGTSGDVEYKVIY